MFIILKHVEAFGNVGTMGNAFSKAHAKHELNKNAKIWGEGNLHLEHLSCSSNSTNKQTNKQTNKRGNQLCGYRKEKQKRKASDC